MLCYIVNSVEPGPRKADAVGSASKEIQLWLFIGLLCEPGCKMMCLLLRVLGPLVCVFRQKVGQAG